jgi:iron(III) transport system permease protein
MTFIRVLGTFGTPALLGLPVRFFTLPTQIYSTLSSRNMGDGFLLALVLVALAIVFIYVNSRLIGVRKSFVTLSGKGFRRRQIALGALRWPVFAIITGSLLCVVVLPLGMLFLESILLESGRYAWDNLTLTYWIGAESSEPGILRNEQILRATWNSLRLGLMAALITGVLGLLIGYAVVCTRGTFSSKALEGIAFTPYIFPSVALGAIYIGMFSQSIGPIPALYGTFALLVLICTVKALPFTSRTGVSAMMQIDRSLEEAARVHGMRWGRRAWRIVLPLAVSGMISGMLLAYITVMRELSLIILLVTPNNNLLTSLIFDYQLQALTQHTGAATIVLVGLIVAAHLLVRLLSRRAHIAEVSVN